MTARSKLPSHTAGKGWSRDFHLALSAKGCAPDLRAPWSHSGHCHSSRYACGYDRLLLRGRAGTPRQGHGVERDCRPLPLDGDGAIRGPGSPGHERAALPFSPGLGSFYREDHKRPDVTLGSASPPSHTFPPARCQISYLTGRASPLGYVRTLWPKRGQ